MATKNIIIPDDLYKNNEIIERNTASTLSGQRTFVNWNSDGNTVRSDYTRDDYDYFRSGAMPKNAKERIKFCNIGYKKNGIIHNVIDLMGDFSSQGITVQHPIPAISRFNQDWFNRVKGKDRSERFLNLLFRQANVPVHKITGKITNNQLKEMKKTYAITDDGYVLDTKNESNRVIPLGYSFLNIDNIDIANNLVGSFTGKKLYTLRISGGLQKELSRLKEIGGDEAKEIFESIPRYILEAIKDNKNTIVLDPTKFEMYFYKKDDWQDWGEPMTFPIMDDVILFDKMKLADLSALDGITSSVRLWTLGQITENPATTIIPKPHQLQYLRSLIANGTGGGHFDLVWGPELKFSESSSNAYQFLGSSKYEPVLDTIYDGLGIPPTLRSGKVSTNANNYIAMKTLVERLNYGRDVLIGFWNKELKLVQEAMGFSEPATVVFDQMVLSDEAAEKQLLIHLADRNMISDEFVRERIKANDRVEKSRIKRENKKKGKSMPHKAGPFHNALPEHDLKKIVLQGGDVTPSEVGLELEERKAGQTPRQDKMMKMKKQQEAKVMKPGGRPKNVVETKKRKKKPIVKTTAESISITIWANEAQKQISDIILPGILASYSKKNVRSLTENQFNEFEQIKAGILFELNPYDEITDEKVYLLLQEQPKTYLAAKSMIDNLCVKVAKNNKKDITVEEIRNVNSQVYSLIKGQNDGEN
jgi:hypothetical protein